jgi:hypothetical protein
LSFLIADNFDIRVSCVVKTSLVLGVMLGGGVGTGVCSTYGVAVGDADNKNLLSCSKL